MEVRKLHFVPHPPIPYFLSLFFLILSLLLLLLLLFLPETQLMGTVTVKLSNEKSGQGLQSSFECVHNLLYCYVQSLQTECTARLCLQNKTKREGMHLVFKAAFFKPLLKEVCASVACQVARSLQMLSVAPADSKALSAPSSESVLSGVSLAKGSPYNPSH